MKKFLSTPIASVAAGVGFLALFGISQVFAGNPVVGSASVTRVGSGATSETIILPILDIGAESITSCEYSLDSGAHWISVGPGSFKTSSGGNYCIFTGLNLVNLTSTGTIQVRAINNLNSLSVSSKSVITDIIPPKITIDSPTTNSDENPSLVIKTDENSNCFYKVDSGILTPLTSTGALVHTAELKNLSNGNHTLNVQCSDWLGNQTSQASTWTIAPLFKDTVDHWGLKYITALKKRCSGIEGYRDAKGNLLYEYRPNNPISRAELVTMVVRCSYGYQAAAMESPFKDVATEAYYSGYVEKALDLGWISGYSDNTFRPGQSVTRSEALKMVLLSQFSAAEITDGDSTVSFTDVAEGWYRSFVYFAVSKGFIEGYRDNTGNLTGQFGPGNNITRAEVAKVIVNVKAWSVN